MVEVYLGTSSTGNKRAWHSWLTFRMDPPAQHFFPTPRSFAIDAQHPPLPPSFTSSAMIARLPLVQRLLLSSLQSRNSPLQPSFNPAKTQSRFFPSSQSNPSSKSEAAPPPSQTEAALDNLLVPKLQIPHHLNPNNSQHPHPRRLP